MTCHYNWYTAFSTVASKWKRPHCCSPREDRQWKKRDRKQNHWERLLSVYVGSFFWNTAMCLWNQNPWASHFRDRHPRPSRFLHSWKAENCASYKRNKTRPKTDFERSVQNFCTGSDWIWCYPARCAVWFSIHRQLWTSITAPDQLSGQ